MSVDRELPPQEIIDMIHFTWKRLRNSLADELMRHGYVRAVGIPKMKASYLGDEKSVAETVQIHNLGFELRHTRPLFPGFPYVYRVMCFGVEVESGPCPQGYEPK